MTAMRLITGIHQGRSCRRIHLIGFASMVCILLLALRICKAGGLWFLIIPTPSSLSDLF